MNKIREALLNILKVRLKPLRIRQELEILEYSKQEIDETLGIGLPSDENYSELRMWRIIFSNWDNAEGAWTNDTLPRSEERRVLILSRLDISGTILYESLSQRRNIPLNEPKNDLAVITSNPDHEDWVTNDRIPVNGYWANYKLHLENNKKWSLDAITNLELTTTRILNHLTDPLSDKLSRVKGLVVGHVQSGKTANYSALIAKAVDVGYRLIIVLSGRTDILRNQTQARLDMELVGWDSLDENERQEYINKGLQEQQNYKSKFVSYNSIPSSQRFLRLTKTAKDFNSGSIALRYTECPQIAVLKKIPRRLNEFAKIIGKSEWRKKPVLLIDDESDDGSINTSKSDITPTAALIAKILDASDASQYVGYTATPYANVFIRPKRINELFPSDFVICLDKPKHYMGAMEIFDIGECEINDDESNEKAYIRAIKEHPSIPENPLAEPPRLAQAIDSFILAGAIKKWREANNKDIHFKHHTMLINTDRLTTKHQEIAEDVESLLGTLYPNKTLDSASDKRLETLWLNDFRPVSLIRNPSIPETWNDLKSFVSNSIDIIINQRVLIVNCENKDDTPDFEDATGCWAILIGGAKLSRGYTIEGLTTSYFSRKPGQLDTLVQMARWYGYRKGYSDLVRLYMPEMLERNHKFPKGSNKKTKDNKYHLIDAFRFGAKVEEAFRKNLIQYSKDLKPKDIPPLVQYEFEDIPQNFKYLKPTASNKSYHVEFETFHLGGVIKTITRIGGSKSCLHNRYQLENLLNSCNIPISEKKLIFKEGQYNVLTGVTDTSNHLSFLENIYYSDKKTDEKPNIIKEQIEALTRMPSISWRIIMFMKKGVNHLEKISNYSLPIMIRNYKIRPIDGVLAYDKPLEKENRKVAAWLAKVNEGMDLISYDPETLNLQNERCGIIYIVPFNSCKDGNDARDFFYLWCAVYPGSGKAGAYRVITS